MMNRFFLFQDEDTNKFWEINIQKNKQIINFGQVGSIGTTKEKEFDTEETCRVESLKVIKSKLKKGYIEIDLSLKLNETTDLFPNNQITLYLKTQLKSYECKLRAVPHLHPLFIELFEDLQQFDFETYKKNAAQEIEQNIKEWWTNPAKGVDLDIVLDAILLEYDDCIMSPHACAYGITNWKDFRFHAKGFTMGYDYEFAGDFESMPAIRLDYFFNLDKFSNLPDDIDEDDLYEMDGYIEILNIYLFAGLVALNEVFYSLDAKNCFDKFKTKKGFMFMIGEHDKGTVYPIYTI